jgi:DNA-binding response OmpR family regulator
MPDLLLIEDDTELREVIREAVEIAGYSVTVARDGEEGLTLLNDGLQPSIIMCDVVLPHMNGLEFLSLVRSASHLRNITFISMSGDDQMKKAALKAGATYYLVKPFSFHDLYAMLEQS